MEVYSAFGDHFFYTDDMRTTKHTDRRTLTQTKEEKKVSKENGLSTMRIQQVLENKGEAIVIRHGLQKGGGREQWSGDILKMKLQGRLETSSDEKHVRHR